MPIVNFTFKPSDLPVNAVNVRAYIHSHGFSSYIDGKYQEVEGPQVIWLHDTYTGLCLRDREMNGYDDSDFYMLVWDEEKGEPTEICFASTRCWSYPSYGSSVDATPEVVAKYNAWCERKQAEYSAADRKAKAKAKQVLRQQIKNVAQSNQVSYVRLLKLRHTGKIDSILKLFGSRIRSGFKLSLRNQLISWLKDDNAKYPTPFSRKQMKYL